MNKLFHKLKICLFIKEFNKKLLFIMDINHHQYINLWDLFGIEISSFPGLLYSLNKKKLLLELKSSLAQKI